MRPARPVLICALLSACGATSPGGQVSRGYDLAFTHPSPRANYLTVEPGTRGAPLPAPGQILEPAFSDYMRRATGCAVDPASRALVLGSKTAPAGYVVPVSCP